MSQHGHREFVEGCYRCDIGQGEAEAAREEILAEAQAAWIRYRDDYQRTHHLNARRAASQMRRREFIAGYLANEDGA